MAGRNWRPGYHYPTIGKQIPLWRNSLSRLSVPRLLTARLSQSRFFPTRLSVLSLAAFLVRLFLMTSGLFAPTAAAVQNPHGAQLVAVKTDTSKKSAPAEPIVVPPGSDLYTT